MPSTETVRRAAGLVTLPAVPQGGFDQDQEWFELERDGVRRRIRFHDYGDIYAVPGLYEHLFYERLQCCSPTVVAELLAEQLALAGEDPAETRVLDLGAGNGMVGEELRERGFEDLVGIDLEPEAGAAVERDRPGLYADYFVCDLLDPPPAAAAELEREPFGALTSVAALGFGDIPPQVFERAWELVAPGGWIAFTIKDKFLDGADPSGFSTLVTEMLRDGRLERRAQTRYPHRLGLDGTPLHYVAIVGRKGG